ncbi:Acg family FMN-binding oxidoreductase [Pseudonocardia sp. CA-107938]|uniref:Acg family FMN-binding oxidoreductase n=1 Tax=Pseudonocardia sp. CA-107938 TaxID=3240021 RepID=UPI003D8DDE60
MTTEQDLVRAVEHALRAPSVHNTQPWRWRIRGERAELFADPHRHLIATDPDGRDLVLSCGAALHHLQVALAAAGYAASVARQPDPEQRDLLARIRIGPGPGDPEDARLFPAVKARRTDRRRMSHRPVPAAAVQRLIEQALRHGALLVHVANGPMRDRLSRVLADAAAEQATVRGYPAELEQWSRRYAGSRDGISAGSVSAPPPGLPGPWPLRPFPRYGLPQPRQVPAHAVPDDAAEFVVVATAEDSVTDRLRAGEAASAVLLAATVAGLATTPLSQGIEVPHARESVRQEVLRIPDTPQLLIRIGWPATHAAELPPTPRRGLDVVLLPA